MRYFKVKLNYIVFGFYVFPMYAMADTMVCLKSENTHRPIYMELYLPENASSIGTVIYKKGNGVIKLKHVDDGDITIQKDKEKSEVLSKWQEVFGNETGGIYTTYFNGDVVSKVIYTDKYKSKNVQFVDVSEEYFLDGCKW